MNKIIFVALSILTLATSCKKKLERDQAKEMIIAHFNYPKKYSEKLQYGEMKFIEGPQKSMESLVAQNMISFDKIAFERTWVFNYVTYNLQLTLEGEKYKIADYTDAEGKTFYTMKLAEETMGDVTGIQETEDGKAAMVQYTTFYSNVSPFAEILAPGKYQNGTMNNRSIQFNKYDDGWRISVY